VAKQLKLGINRQDPEAIPPASTTGQEVFAVNRNFTTFEEPPRPIPLLLSLAYVACGLQEQQQVAFQQRDDAVRIVDKYSSKRICGMKRQGTSSSECSGQNCQIEDSQKQTPLARMASADSVQSWLICSRFCSSHTSALVPRINQETCRSPQHCLVREKAMHANG
jgi:hypothetical protein